MLLLAGTVPLKDLPLTSGKVHADGEFLVVNDFRIPCTQGTGAMASAALAATNYLKLEPPQLLVAGDIGQGKGSREMYEFLTQKVTELSPEVLALHYCLPDMALMRRLCKSIDRCALKPIMIADAGSMYAAKAAGLASAFNIFTPDATEMAFLADPDATHPAYIARHLFDTDVTQTPKLVAAAYGKGNAARILLVKGAIDYIVQEGNIIVTITDPDVPALEAIGGTGDTITGLTAALTFAGMKPIEAAIVAAKSNRMAGKFAQATPAMKVGQIIAHFPSVFENYFYQWSSDCYTDIGG